MDKSDVRTFLAAFADGELDVEQNLRVLEHVKMDPQAAARVTHQQQLREATARWFEQHAAPAPPLLRDRIERATREGGAGNVSGNDAAPGAPPRRDERPGGERRRWVGWATAVAAAVLLGISLTAVYLAGGLSGERAGDTRAGGPRLTLAAGMVEGFAARHRECSRSLEMLHRLEGVEADLRRVPSALARHFQDPQLAADRPPLDLSAIGYEFKGVGHCTIPGQGALHFVYHRLGQDDGEDALSLWITRYAGQPSIAADDVYRAADATSSAPILVWRRGGLVCYLVGESPGPVRQGAAALRGGEAVVGRR